MRKHLIRTAKIIALITVGYFIGSISKSISIDNRLMDEYYWRVCDVPKYEREFLKTLEIETPNNLKSGEYVFEVWLPGKKTEISTIYIPFKDGQFNYEKKDDIKRVGMEESAHVEFPIVSWYREGRLFDPGVRYVGIVMGDKMWGRVYCYNQGPKEELGFWKIYPKRD